MKKILNILYTTILCTTIAAVLLCGGIVGCASQAVGTFYSLDEAYQNGWLSQDDLQEIADLHNHGLQSAENLDDKIAECVKETAAWVLKHDEKSPIPEAKAEDFTILKYYGVYRQDCYVVMLDEPYFDFPAVDVDEWEEIGGVQFHITSFYEIKVWKNNKG